MLFPNLSQTWNIIILIILILVAVYLLILITNLVFVFSFGKMMRRDNRGIRVALSAKLDILVKSKEIIEANGIKISEKTAHSLKYLDSEDFLEVQKDEFVQAHEELNEAEKEVSNILYSSRKLSGNDEVELLKSLLKDINDSLRTSVMAYNADVLGYNYWVRFGPCLFIFLMFKVKLKKTI